MKKRGLLILGLSMALMSGIAYTSTPRLFDSINTIKKAAESTCYTLTPTTGSNNSYASNCDIKIGDITWNVTGNSQEIPWRIGGKSITGVDRSVYSKTALAKNVSKIELTIGTANSITVNSLTVIVSKNSDFSNPVSTITPKFAASSTITINRPDGKDWSNCYYKFTFNVTVSSTSNKFVQFSGATFYSIEETPEDTYSISYELDGGTNHKDNPFNIAQGSSVTLKNPTKNGCNFAGWFTDSLFTNQITAWPYTPTSNITFYAKWDDLTITNISDVISSGTYYRVTGEVIAQNSNKSIYIQDSTGGIQFYASAASDISSIKIGNTITFTAVASTYNDIIQLSGSPINLSIADENDTTINTTPLTGFDDITTNNKGKYVSIEGLTLTSAISTGKASTYVENETTKFYLYGVQSYMKDASAISSETGTKVNLTGVIAIHDSLPEIILTTIVECTKYTVTFHTDPLDGSDPTTSSNVYSGDTVAKPSAPSKDSDANYTYTFDNWYTDANCNEDAYVGTAYDFCTAVTNDLVLYARFTKEARTSYTDDIATFETKSALSYQYTYSATSSPVNLAFTSSEKGYGNGETVSSITFDSNVSAILDKGTGNNAPKYYNTGSAIRIYSGGTMAITSTSGNISAITLTFSDSSNTGTFGASTGTYSLSTTTGSWTGDASTITFTNNASGQARITGISITYTKTTTSYTFNDTAIRFGGLISKEYWTNIDNTGGIDDYGIMLLKDDTLATYTAEDANIDTIAEAYNAGKTVTKKSFVDEFGGILEPDEYNTDYYLFNAKLSFSDDTLFTTVFHAAAYMVVDSTYYFFQEAAYSVKTLAQAYIDDTDLVYDTTSFDGSLGALANYGA